MLNIKDRQLIDSIEEKLREKEEFSLLEKYIQHGKVSTYQHVRSVAEMSCRLNRCLLNSSADSHALVKGALLHDFYLYDWHEKKLRQLHGYNHPKAAYDNARRIYDVDEKVGGIILSHMWPLTLRSVPRTKEAFIVSLADKIISTRETLFKR